MIIMLAGRRKSGKSTFADYVTEINPDIKAVAFGDILKEMMAEELGIPIHDLHDSTRKERYRGAMQQFGAKHREKDPFVFARTLFAMMDPTESYIIHDLRYIEELQVGMKYGGVPYRVYADSNTRKSRGFVYDPVVDEHISETEMDLSRETFTALGGGWIYNTTGLDSLQRQAMTLLSDISV